MSKTEVYDSRHIDRSIATLEGEASNQRPPAKEPAPLDVWTRTPSREPQQEPTYYDRPVIKQPVWNLAVPAYFYVGGTAGAALVLGAAAQSMNGPSMRNLVRRCRWIGAIGCMMGSGFLIYDLGRPSRFLNMLRIFRPTSPLSVGSWLLALTGSAATTAALFMDVPILAALAECSGYACGLLGMPLAGYTGVLLASTAVPIWQQTRRSLPALFIAGGMSGAASLLEMMPRNRREATVVHRFGVAGKIAELAAIKAFEREAHQVEQVGKPLRHGLTGALWNGARMMTAVSLVLSLLPGRSKPKRVVAGVLGTLGAIGMRYAVMRAGVASARDPRATFQQQRAGRGAAEIMEEAAVLPRAA